MTSKITIIGCGVVGTMIAYELTRQNSAQITVIDNEQGPGEGATGAALGVLMGIISHKVKGRTWRLREASVGRYRTLIDELAAAGESVPFNRDGIVSLCFDASRLSRWEQLKEKRSQQGWPLEVWSLAQLKERCPQISLQLSKRDNSSDDLSIEKEKQIVGAVYSPADGQVHPVQLTRALVTRAQAAGAEFKWNTSVLKLHQSTSGPTTVETDSGSVETDWVVVSAGMGFLPAAKETTAPEKTEHLTLMPVLGQALTLQLPAPLGHANFQPVFNGHDIQCVPLGAGRYWIGATVEFPQESGKQPAPAEDGLSNLLTSAAQFCPAFAEGTVERSWYGIRPRPVGEPAPVIRPMSGWRQVLLATGHYRNGVLLAPATAIAVRDAIAQHD